jgi:pyrroline-5-carboxylate reductase
MLGGQWGARSSDFHGLRDRTVGIAHELIHCLCQMTDSKQPTRVGILGTGNMGAAIIRGLIAADKIARTDIYATDVATDRLHELAANSGICAVQDNRTLAAQCDVVILAVKPQNVARVLDDIGPAVAADRLFVSIAAGVTTLVLEQALPPTARVVRTMPNTPAVVLASVTAIAPGSRAKHEDMALVRFLFESVGRVIEVDESMLDAVTGLSGSGPAYVLLAIEAMADGGVRMGLTRQTALLLAAQTVFGTAKMVLETNIHPAQLRDNVTSPNGTTIAGLAALEQSAVRHAFISAVRAATLRSIELGQAATNR